MKVILDWKDCEKCEGRNEHQIHLKTQKLIIDLTILTIENFDLNRKLNMIYNALSATRGQWIHSGNSDLCLMALREGKPKNDESTD